jgi:hypothetical protein
MFTGQAFALSPADQVGAGAQVVRGAQYVQSVQLEEGVAFVTAVQNAELAEFVAALQVPTVAPERRAGSTSNPALQNGGGGLSDERLRALSQCESGGQNGWRTGYFGIEAGYPIGNLSWDEQAAWARRIYAEHGSSAWGCPV